MTDLALYLTFLLTLQIFTNSIGTNFDLTEAKLCFATLEPTEDQLTNRANLTDFWRGHGTMKTTDWTNKQTDIELSQLFSNI